MNSPAVRRPCGDLAAAVPQRAGDRDAAQELHQRRQQRQHARHLQVGPEQRVGDALELRRLAPLGAERLDDAVAGERLGGDVRHVLLRFLAPARHGAHPLAEAHQRIDHQRRRRHAHQRQLGVVVEQQRHRADQHERFAGQVADRFRHRALHHADVVVDARQQLPHGAAREERRRLVEHVTEQLVAHHHHDAVAEPFHQVAGKIRAEALEQVDHQDRRRDRRQVALRDQHIVDHRLDQIRQRRVRGPVDDHRQCGTGNDRAVRGRVTKQAQESVHQ